jgi:hypothetical protein
MMIKKTRNWNIQNMILIWLIFFAFTDGWPQFRRWNSFTSLQFFRSRSWTWNWYQGPKTTYFENQNNGAFETGMHFFQIFSNKFLFFVLNIWATKFSLISTIVMLSSSFSSSRYLIQFTALNLDLDFCVVCVEFLGTVGRFQLGFWSVRFCFLAWGTNFGSVIEQNPVVWYGEDYSRRKFSG